MMKSKGQSSNSGKSTRKFEIIDETVRTTRRINNKKDYQKGNHHKLRKTLHNNNLLQNYFEMENSNTITTYKVVQQKEDETKLIVSERLQFKRTTKSSFSKTTISPSQNTFTDATTSPVGEKKPDNYSILDEIAFYHNQDSQPILETLPLSESVDTQQHNPNIVNETLLYHLLNMIYLFER